MQKSVFKERLCFEMYTENEISFCSVLRIEIYRCSKKHTVLVSEKIITVFFYVSNRIFIFYNNH